MQLPNAWFASVAGHPLWLFCTQEIIARQAKASLMPTRCVFSNACLAIMP